MSHKSLWIREANVSIRLGDFVLLKGGVASVCMTDLTRHIVRETNPWYTEDPPTLCMPFRVASDDLRTSSTANGTAYAFNDTKSFRANFHSPSPLSDRFTDVCHDMLDEILTCENAGILVRDEFRFLFNMDVEEIATGTVHPLGSYVLPPNADAELVLFCTTPKDNSTDERLYGLTSIVSAVFLFLTLLVHVLVPSLNQHSTVLLCHIVSMLVGYVTLSISYLVDKRLWSPEFLQYILFGVGYVASLGSFLWLGVLAFQLWRVFSIMRITDGDPERGRRPPSSPRHSR